MNCIKFMFSKKGRIEAAKTFLEQRISREMETDEFTDASLTKLHLLQIYSRNNMKTAVLLALAFCAALVSSHPLPEGERLRSEVSVQKKILLRKKRPH